MDNSKPLHHKKLNDKQLVILRLLYRFRFATSDLLTQTIGIKDKNKMNQRLRLLVKQGYIGRTYKPEYRLRGQPASYHLLPKGVKALRQVPGDQYDEKVLHNAHKNKSASDQFIDHWLAVFSVYCTLRKQYGDDLKFFTSTQLTKYGYFPRPLPDAYIRLGSGDVEKQFFLDVLHESKPFFLATRKVMQYITYAEEGEWDARTSTSLPRVLLVSDNIPLQKRLTKRMRRAIEGAEGELNVYITTLDNLKGIVGRSNDGIWQNIREPDEILSLMSM
jgi:hypothetical protein